MVAALELIFTSSARYGVSAADLSSELQQLGLPREHSAAIARLHTDHCPQITATLSSQSLRGKEKSNLTKFSRVLRKTVRVNAFTLLPVSRLSSIEVLPRDNASPFSTVCLKLKKLDGNIENSVIGISKKDVQVLLTGND